MWEKLVTIDTFHWYCDGLEPTTTTHRYDAQVCQRKSITQYIYICVCFFKLLTSVPFVQNGRY